MASCRRTRRSRRIRSKSTTLAVEISGIPTPGGTLLCPVPLIRAEKLTKRFGSFVAVDGVDFAVERGEAFGFLGPNGAGKSSTMRMIGCVSPVGGGTLRIFDLDPEHDGSQIRSRLGVVPQQDSLDEE